ncbi:hypothetical protein DRV85_15715 [Rhodosalinus halophilus]|uniref:Uncharacterized protein n=1 Tax=Rhodosalinus halophilus TaxID=2259333 RepID=A0A365U604_9RHOB|nr:hypothetical protein [Rhodosalinus halophilus]RBI83501.1 hypothetical protein DRV85_15715 [Rhodosalinus halophilus]
MTDHPIDLDGRRTAAERHDSEMRRRPANGAPAPEHPEHAQVGRLDDQMLAEPARTWVAVMEKWRFLLERYSATSDADDRIRKLISRAISDMERLRKREERK